MSNRLAGSLSLYLRQHANDPVHWYPWGEEAFAAARQTQRPVFLSAGYASCHWCHVMARESFRDPAVADLLNAGFVCIKVDREERPDVDDYYMTAAQAMTGSGGWPLSVFLTPEGKPFHAGTYYPPVDRHGMPSFTRLLRAVMNAWTERRDEVIDSAERIGQSIERIGGPLLAGAPDLASAATDETATVVEAAVSAALRALAAQEDQANGGFGDARGGPKFPPHSALGFLLSIGGDTAIGVARRALDAMADGGLYDHLAGGFFRYSVDPAWRVPHFEKMLYDNAQLMQAYALAHAATGEERYRRVALGVLDWLDEEMLQVPAAGRSAYASSLDADSEGEEGRFYAWTERDFRQATEAEGELVARATAARFGITATGDFEGGNVLRLATAAGTVATALGLAPDEVDHLIERGVDALSAARALRVRPTTDDKVLTSWNGLVLSALAATGTAAAEPRALKRALELARFLVGLREDGRLTHLWRGGETTVTGLLEDHVFLGNGLLDLYTATLEPWLLTEALRLADDVDAHFADPAGGGWFDTADWLAGAPARLKSHTDSAVPSRYVAAARLTWRAGRILSDGDRVDRAVAAVLPLARAAADAPQALGSALALLNDMTRPEREVVIVGSRAGPDMPEVLRAVRENTVAGDVLLLLDPADELEGSHPLASLPLAQGRYPPASGGVTAYVCRGGACRLPVHDADGVRRAMLAG